MSDPSVSRRPRGLHVSTLMVWVLIIGVVIGILARAVRQAREAAEASACHGRFDQIGLALRNYQSVWGTLPPAYTTDANGRRMHSWRILLAPHFSSDPIVAGYRMDESWDGPNNRKVLDSSDIFFFRCPRRESKPGMTNYVMIVDPKSPTSATGRTILIAEISNVDIPWTEPRDLEVDSMSWVLDDPAKPGISSVHDVGPAVLLADGTVFRLGRFVPEAELRQLVAPKNPR